MRLGMMAIVLFMATTLYSAPLPTGSVEDDIVRIEAIVKKGKPKPSDIQELTSALKNSGTNIRVKERAAWALGELNATNATGVLIEAAKHKGLLIRSAALNALIHLRAKSAFTTFVSIAENDPILSLRQNATLGLGLLQTEKAIDPLVKLSEDLTPEVRSASVLAMASLHSQKNSFTELLKEMLADPNPYVQDRVKKGLEVTARNNLEVLEQLKSSDGDIRLFAALYFQQHGRSKDLKPLDTAFNGEADEAVRYQLKKSITAIKKRAAAAAAEAKQKKASPAPSATK